MEFCWDQCWKLFRKRVWMMELGDLKFQDSEDANTKTLWNNITQLTSWVMKWSKKFSNDEYKVIHGVVVRITFWIVNFHWIKIDFYQWGGGYWSYHRFLYENPILLSSDRRQYVPIWISCFIISLLGVFKKNQTTTYPLKV